MDEEKAHNLYTQFKHVDANARFKRGLGFDDSHQQERSREKHSPGPREVGPRTADGDWKKQLFVKAGAAVDVTSCKKTGKAESGDADLRKHVKSQQWNSSRAAARAAAEIHKETLASVRAKLHKPHSWDDGIAGGVSREAGQRLGQRRDRSGKEVTTEYERHERPERPERRRRRRDEEDRRSSDDDRHRDARGRYRDDTDDRRGEWREPDRHHRRNKSRDRSRSPEGRRGRHGSHGHGSEYSRSRNRDASRNDRCRRDDDRKGSRCDRSDHQDQHGRPDGDARSAGRHHDRQKPGAGDRDNRGGSRSEKEAINWEEIVPGYSSMSLAQQLKARTRYELRQARASAPAVDAESGGTWTRFVFNRDAMLDEDGAAPTMEFEELQHHHHTGESNRPLTRLAHVSQHASTATGTSQGDHEAAIFGSTKTGASCSDVDVSGEDAMVRDGAGEVARLAKMAAADGATVVEAGLARAAAQAPSSGAGGCGDLAPELAVAATRGSWRDRVKGRMNAAQ